MRAAQERLPAARQSRARVEPILTYFACRVCASGLSESELEERLTALCRQKLQALADAQMIELTADVPSVVRSRQLGYLMARFCVELETMCLFNGLASVATELDVLKLLSSSKEFESGIVLRHNEKKTLAAINADKKVRYPIDGSRKAKCKTPASKAFLLLQLRAGGSSLEQFEDARPVIVEKGGRILRALVEYAEHQGYCSVLLAAVQLHRSLVSGAGWHDAPTAAFQQFSGVGAHFAAKLAEASGGGLVAFTQLTGRRVTQIMAKGAAVLSDARALLRSGLELELGLLEHDRASVTVRTTASEAPTLDGAQFRQSGQSWRVLVERADGALVLTRKFTDGDVSGGNGQLSYSFSLPPQPGAPHRLVAHLVSVRAFGLDLTREIGPPADPAAPAAASSAGQGRPAALPRSKPSAAAARPATQRPAAGARDLPRGAFDTLATLDLDGDSDGEEGLQTTTAVGNLLQHAAGPAVGNSLQHGAGPAVNNPDGDLFGEIPSFPEAGGSLAAGGARALAGKQPAVAHGAGLCSHTCKDKTACGHLCCKEGKVQRKRGSRDKAPARPTSTPAPRSFKLTPPPLDAHSSAFFDRFRAPNSSHRPFAPPTAHKPPALSSSAPEDSLGLGFSSDGVVLRDGSTLTPGGRFFDRAPAGDGGRKRLHAPTQSSGAKHVDELRALAHSVPSTPVRRLPIPPLPEHLDARTPITSVAPRGSNPASSVSTAEHSARPPASRAQEHGGQQRIDLFLSRPPQSQPQQPQPRQQFPPFQQHLSSRQPPRQPTIDLSQSPPFEHPWHQSPPPQRPSQQQQQHFQQPSQQPASRRSPTRQPISYQSQSPPLEHPRYQSMQRQPQPRQQLPQEQPPPPQQQPSRPPPFRQPTSQSPPLEHSWRESPLPPQHQGHYQQPLHHQPYQSYEPQEEDPDRYQYRPARPMQSNVAPVTAQDQHNWSAATAPAPVPYSIGDTAVRPTLNFRHGNRLSADVLAWLDDDDAPKPAKKARISPSKKSQPALPSMTNLRAFVSPSSRSVALANALANEQPAAPRLQQTQQAPPTMRFGFLGQR